MALSFHRGCPILGAALPFAVALACGPAGPAELERFGEESGDDLSSAADDESGSHAKDDAPSETSDEDNPGPLLDIGGGGGSSPDLPDPDPPMPMTDCGVELVSFPVTVEGTTVAAGDQHMGSCASGPAPEREFLWTAPTTGSVRISLAGSDFDTMLYVRADECGGPELACSDDSLSEFGAELWSELVVELEAGQRIAIFVDGYNGAGSFVLTIEPA